MLLQLVTAEDGQPPLGLGGSQASTLQEVEVVLEAPLSEGVEEASLLVVLMEEEEELIGLGVVVVQEYHPLSDSVWLSLALTSADFEDVVCTKVAVAPAKVRTCLLLLWTDAFCWPL